MRIKPIITRNDIKLVKEICNKQKDNPIYKERLRVNLKQAPLNLRKEALWKYIVTCLLTTQQRSGENSHIYKFLKNSFTPLRLSQLEQQKIMNTNYCHLNLAQNPFRTMLFIVS